MQAGAVGRGEHGGLLLPPSTLRPHGLSGDHLQPTPAPNPLQPYTGALLILGWGVSTSSQLGSPCLPCVTPPANGPTVGQREETVMACSCPTPVPLELAPAPGLYHLNEEVANLLQHDDGVGRRAVVLAVSTEEADGAQCPVHVGLQLWEQSPVSVGPWPC